MAERLTPPVRPGANLEALRVRGVRGGVIAPHRSMAGLDWNTRRLVSTLGLTGGGLAVVFAGIPWLGDFWGMIFTVIRDRLSGVVIPLGTRNLPLPFGLEISLPTVHVATPQPTTGTLLVAAVLSALVFAATFLLPPRFIPAKYFLRLLAILQASAIICFAVRSPRPFPTSLDDHVFLLLTAGLVIIALVPVVLGLTLHVFDVSFTKKALVSVALMSHLTLFVPLQVMVHVWLVLRYSAVVMPVLFLVFGLLMDVMVCVSFYGWVLSSGPPRNA